MSGSYKTICRLRILHNYYNKGFNNDFSFIALPQTQKLAKQYKLLFREVENGIDILSQMIDSDTPARDLADSNKLSFALMLKNTDLLNYTQLPKKSDRSQLYQLENNPAFGNTITVNEWDLATAKPASFAYSTQSEANEVILKATDPYSAAFTTKMIKSGDVFTTAFDLGTRPEGKYLLQTINNGQVQAEEKIYTSELLWQTRPFAIIDIFSKELDYAGLKTYSIRLGAKKVLWTYRVNLTKNYTDSNIIIEDSREPSEVLFKLIGNTNQSSGKTLTFRPFNINAPAKYSKIRFSETPLNHFNLIIEKNGKKTEIKGLPNPAINQVKTEMHINI